MIPEEPERLQRIAAVRRLLATVLPPIVVKTPAVPDWDEEAHEAELLERWPHLRRPGPQPCNRIASNALDQLRRARRGRRRQGCRCCRRQQRRLARFVVLALDRDLVAAAALVALLREVASGKG